MEHIDEQNNNQPISHEQLAAEERANKSDSLRAEIENHFKAHVLETTIERHANRAHAFNPSQIVALLRDRTSVTQAVDKDGNAIVGQYEVTVAGDNGEPTTVGNAIEQLRTSSRNLFFSREDLLGFDDARDGETPTQRAARLAKNDPERYRAERQKLLGLRQRRNNR